MDLESVCTDKLNFSLYGLYSDPGNKTRTKLLELGKGLYE